MYICIILNWEKQQIIMPRMLKQNNCGKTERMRELEVVCDGIERHRNERNGETNAIITSFLINNKHCIGPLTLKKHQPTQQNLIYCGENV